MDESKPVGTAGASREHPANGVETGFQTARAARLLGEAAMGWREKDTLPVQLLRALARLTEAHPDRASLGFTSAEVADAISAQLGRRWFASDDPGDASKKLRPQWKQLEVKWESKREGVHQLFADRGWILVPRPIRIEGGGSGHLTRYRIDLEAMRQEAAGVTERDSGAHPQCAPEAGAITYICEDLDDAGPLARFFSRGLSLGSRLGAAFRVFVVAAIIATALLVYLLLVGSLYASEVFGAGLIAAGLIAAAYASTIHPLVSLPIVRIALAPWWLQSVDDDRLLEWRGPPRFEGRNIKASRYTAQCPACGGRVVARSGGWRRSFALVGRCMEAPDVHVYSFDHVLRRGGRIG